MPTPRKRKEVRLIAANVLHHAIIIAKTPILVLQQRKTF